jgi:hypothetical protein
MIKGELIIFQDEEKKINFIFSIRKSSIYMQMAEAYLNIFCLALRSTVLRFLKAVNVTNSRHILHPRHIVSKKNLK